MAQDRRDSLAPSAMGALLPCLDSTKEDHFTSPLNRDLENPTAAPNRAQLHKLNPGEPAQQPQTDPNQATATRLKQKVMVPSKRKGGGRATGGRAKRKKTQSTTQARQSAASEAVPKPNLKLNLKLGPKPTQDFSQSLVAQPYQYQEPVNEEQKLPKISRSGRAIRKPHDPQVVYGGDIDQQIDLSSVGQGEDEDDYKPNMRSSPPYTENKSNRPQTDYAPRKRGRPSKKTSFDPFGSRAPEQAYASSRTLGYSAPAPPALDNKPFQPEDQVFRVMDTLRNDSEIPIDLPFLCFTEGDGTPQPYSAKFLTQLYILCYQNNLWDLCDLVTDTWIRAFHSVRKKGYRNSNYAVWRPNKALERRHIKHLEARRQGIHIPPEFDQDPPEYNLTVADPELDPDVTALDTNLLNELYARTNQNCGARLLWADALALAGSKTEQALQDTSHYPLHPDFLFNIMQTSLRMVRRNLTLKIEESTEGAWCKRYHEHVKHGYICYREKAWKRAKSTECKNNNEFAQEEYLNKVMNRGDQEEVQLMGAHLQQELEERQMSPAKRVRFGEHVGVDVDAQGEPE